MSSGAAFAFATLASWISIGAFLITIYHFFAFRSHEGFKKATELRSCISALLVGGVFLLIAETLPKSPNFVGTSPFYIPVIWPILPFAAWASIACVLTAIAMLAGNLVGDNKHGPEGTAAGNPKTQDTRHKTPASPLLWQRVPFPLAWLFGAALFFVFFKRSGDEIHIAKGVIPLTINELIAIAVLAIATLYVMAGTAKTVRLRGFAKAAAIHAVLLAGCVVFGLPFLWLVITSFKEDRDMASPNGLVWVPKVQETVTTFDTEPPTYETKFRGRTVRTTVISNEPGGNVLLDIISPTGMQGQAIESPESEIKRVPTDAPVVSGQYRGQKTKGFVVKELDDGRRKVKILDPPFLKGEVYTALSTEVEPVRDVGLRVQNYSEALGYLPLEADFGLVYLRNTLIVVVLSVIGTILSSSVVAYAFSRLRFPGRDLLFGLLVSTMMLPAAVTLLPRFIIFRDLGWIDTLLPLWAPAFFASAFNVFLLRQFFKGIPTELEDAAKIDGCSYLKTYWSVMLPQIKAAMAVIGIWTFMAAWNDFMGPLIYVNSPEKMTISYAVQLFSADRSSQPGLLMAFAAMSMVPVLMLFFFAQRYFIEGVTLSGFGGK